LDGTWRAYGVDANSDGRADVYDPVDAIWGAANYLCANGAGNADTVRGAIWAYNHADWYVDEVLHIAATYAAESETLDAHVLPLDLSVSSNILAT